MRVWQEVPLGEVIERITGGKNIEAGSGTSAFQIMKVSAVTSGVFKPNEAKPAPDGHVPAPEHHVREADFLFSRANTSELVGAVAIAHNPPDGLLLPDKVWRIEWNCKRIYPRYAYYMLRSAELRRVLGLISSGTSGSMKNISQGKLVRVLVPLPPLDEQQRIVELLDRAADIMRRADAARAKARAIIPALFLDTFGDPTTSTRGWPLVRLGDVASVGSGAGFPKDLQGQKDQEFPFLKVSDMNLPGNEVQITRWNNTVSDVIRKKLRATAFPAGSIIFPKVGAAIATNKKRILIRSCCVDNNVMAVSFDTRLTDAFGLALFNTKNISEFASASEPPSMRKTAVEEWEIPLPPLSFQTSFAEQVLTLESLARHLDAAAAKADAMAAGLSAEVFGSPASSARRNAA